MTEEQVFLNALDLPTSSDRSAYLDSVCGADTELRQQVEELLAAHFKSGEFLNEPVGEPLGTTPIPYVAETLIVACKPDEDPVAGRENPDEEQPELAFLQPSTRPDSLGRIGHYEVLEVLGKGGFGIVVRAFDDVLQRVVALKVLAPAIAATSPARKRFLREAQASARVRHENVVQVHAVEELPTPYLVMEFIAGETLQQRLDRKGPLQTAEIVSLGRQIAEGLAAAHATGLIHRDIKPGNVLIEGGSSERVKITDFGLARAADDASMTQSGVVAGTPMFMAPEQAQGDTLDQRADLFSLGSVLYVMASGRPPFRAATTFAVLKRVVEEAPRPITDLIPETPHWLCDIITKLHAKNPDDRFQSAREVADVLADCEAQLKTNAKLKDFSRIPKSKLSAAGKSGRWKWAAAAALLLPVLALAVTEFAGLTHLFRGQEPTPDSITSEIVPAPIVAAQRPPDASEAVGPAIVHGVITNEAGIPFHRAHVYLESKTRGGGYSGLTPQAYTDDQGRYAITTSDPNDCSYIIVDPPSGSGYEYSSRKLTLKKGDNLQANFGLVASKSVTIEYVYQPNGTRSFKQGTKRGTILLEPPNFGFIFSQGVAHGTATPDDLRFESKDGQWQFRNFHVNSREQQSGFYNAGAVPFDGVAEAAETGYTNSAKPVVVGQTYVVRTLEGHYVKLIVKSIGAPSPAAKTPPVAFGPFTDADVKRIAALPPAEQVEEVRKELMRRNPGFDGKVKHKIEGNALTEFAFNTDQILDIAPVRALTGLVYLDLRGTYPNKGKLADLSPLKGMKLSRLDCSSTQIADLGPLTGVPLTTLHVNHNPVIDLTPLKGMKLVSLGIAETKVTDLMPLKGMKIKVLGAQLLPVTDLSPLEGMPLTGLDLYHTVGVTKLDALKGMPLEGLNLQDVPVKDLAPLKGMSTLRTLQLVATDVFDLSPLAGLKLTDLILSGNQITDLAPLKGLPLKRLHFYGTGIRDLRPLQDMPLEDIRLNPKNITQGLDILRGMKGLKAIGIGYEHSWPAAEFWERYDKGEFAAAPFTDADVKRIASLPAAEQVEEVRKELMRRNPGFDGKVGHKIENDVVTELKVVTDQVTDIAPIRVFNALRMLDLSGTQSPTNLRFRGQLADLSPLKGMSLAHLTQLNLGCTKVTDAGMAYFKDCKDLVSLRLDATKVTDKGLIDFQHCTNMTYLNLGHTQVSDAGLALFKDWKNLTQLFLSNTQVSDVGLAHFKDCKDLTTLLIQGTKITDLSPLKGMPLKDLVCDFQPARDGEILRSIKTLEKINGKPAAEFWKEVEQK